MYSEKEELSICDLC